MTVGIGAVAQFPTALSWKPKKLCFAVVSLLSVGRWVVLPRTLRMYVFMGFDTIYDSEPLSPNVVCAIAGRACGDRRAPSKSATPRLMLSTAETTVQTWQKVLDGIWEADLSISIRYGWCQALVSQSLSPPHALARWFTIVRLGPSAPSS